VVEWDIKTKTLIRSFTAVLQTFTSTFASEESVIFKVIELKSDIVVSASRRIAWRYGEFRVDSLLSFDSGWKLCELMKLKKGFFACRTLGGQTVHVMDEYGGSVTKLQNLRCWITRMVRLADGSLLVGGGNLLVVKK